MSDKYPTEAPSEFVPIINNNFIGEGTLRTQISGITKNTKVDSKPYVDITGAQLTTSGYELVTFKLDFKAWNLDGKNAIYDLVHLLTPKIVPASKKVSRGIEPVSIYHPDLDEHGVTAFLCTSINGPEFDMEKKTYSLSVSCLQWAKAAVGVEKQTDNGVTPKETKAGGKPPDSPSQANPADRYATTR